MATVLWTMCHVDSDRHPYVFTIEFKRREVKSDNRRDGRMLSSSSDRNMNLVEESTATYGKS